jgi:hypothetical protein
VYLARSCKQPDYHDDNAFRSHTSLPVFPLRPTRSMAVLAALFAVMLTTAVMVRGSGTRREREVTPTSLCMCKPVLMKPRGEYPPALPLLSLTSAGDSNPLPPSSGS